MATGGWMYWMMLLMMALGLIGFAKRLETIDEVFALATYSAGALSVLWGFLIAPFAGQLFVEALACGWLGLRLAQS